MRVALLVLLGSVLASGDALGHGAASGPAATTTSPSAWDLAVVAGLLVAGALYLLGSRRLSARQARVRGVERASFWVGWVSMLVAVAPPMDRASVALFSMHMAQHELLMLIGAPLMIVGRPLVPWLWALPDRLRPSAGRVLQTSAVGGLWGRLTQPAIAWALHGAVVWVWHVPAFYEAAVRSEALHAFQHATFVGTSVLFWWGLIYGRYGRAAYGASAFYVFLTSLHTGVLGAIFALSERPFYPLYATRAALAGQDAAIDQQLAGLYMWIPAGIILMVFGLALVVAWLAESERRTRASGTLLMIAALALTSAACGSIPHEASARQLTGGDPSLGRHRIRHYGCDSCHTIPGVPTADATVGPPLTAVARRVYLAGHIENTPENMIRWIRNPHTYDAQTAMPEMGVTERDARDIVAYLYSLR